MFEPKTYYCLNLNGTVRDKLTKIVWSPSKKIQKTETAFGDIRSYPDEVTIEFYRGSYTCYEEYIARYLDVYTPGGYYSLSGKGGDEVYVEGNNWGFLVTSEDPNTKVRTQEVIREKEVQKTVFPESMISSFNVRQLEQILNSLNIELTGVSPTKDSFIELLRANGHIV